MNARTKRSPSDHEEVLRPVIFKFAPALNLVLATAAADAAVDVWIQFISAITCYTMQTKKSRIKRNMAITIAITNELGKALDTDETVPKLKCHFTLVRLWVNIIKILTDGLLPCPLPIKTVSFDISSQCESRVAVINGLMSTNTGISVDR